MRASPVPSRRLNLRQRMHWFGRTAIALAAITVLLTAAARGEVLNLESDSILVRVDRQTGRWSLLDKRSGVRWPSDGTASPGSAKGLEPRFESTDASANRVRLKATENAAVVFELVDGGETLQS